MTDRTGLGWTAIASSLWRCDLDGLAGTLRPLLFASIPETMPWARSFPDEPAVSERVQQAIRRSTGLWYGAGGHLVHVPACIGAARREGPDSIAELVEWTTSRILTRVEAIQQSFVRLAELFRALAASPPVPGAAHARLAEHLEQVVDFVVVEEGCDDAWYSGIVPVVRWYAESRGHLLDAELEGTLERIFETRFESWVRPERELVKTTCEEAALAAIQLEFDRQYLAKAACSLERLPAPGLVSAGEAWPGVRGLDPG